MVKKKTTKTPATKKPAKKRVTKEQVKKERSPAKVKKVIKQKGHPSGKLPKGKELHHVKPVSEGGKTTEKNTRVVTKKKHIQIHKNRRKKGKV
ncbi:HNH endonuclease [bacterium]|nr:HNH endonuclease [bacterium]